MKNLTMCPAAVAAKRRKIDRFRRLFMRVLGMQTLRSACDEIFRRYFQVRSMRKAAELQ